MTKKLFPFIPLLIIVLFMSGCSKQDEIAGSYPTGSSSNPLNHATSVALNAVVQVSFSEAMDPASINSSTFTLRQGTTVVAGTVGYSRKTASFTPSVALIAGTDYAATITTGAQTMTHKALTANMECNFATLSAVPNLGVVVPGAKAN